MKSLVTGYRFVSCVNKEDCWNQCSNFMYVKNMVLEI